MADNDKVVKIYDLSIQGDEDVLKSLDAINKKFIDLKKNKLALDASTVAIEDPAQLAKVNKELTDLALKEKNLLVELKQKQVALKELQLLAAAEREAAKQAKAGNDALAGSYNEINKKYKELLAISKNTTNLFDPQAVAEAQTELKKYKDLLDNFSRGLTKDGTLVGEYTTGILQAFKNSGLDDVIKDQLTKAKQNVADLDKEFEELKNELRDIQTTGKGSLQAIEQQLIENRTAAAGFTDQINRVETELRGMNSTGSSIASSIGLQFRNLKQDIAGFVLGFVGFQAALSGVQSFVSGAISEFEQAETARARFEGRLKNLGRTNELEGLLTTVDELAGKFKNLDNDDLVNVTEKLVTYGNVSESQIKQLLPLIVDFAANTGESVQTATDAVVKALEGNGKALKVYGIDMKDAGNAAEAYALVTEVLGAKVRGTAEIFSKTASGELAAQKQALKDQQEILGERLLPLYIQLSSVLASFAGFVLSIPFGAWATGIGLVTSALILYKAEQIRAYVVTQIAAREGLIYRGVLLLQAAATNIATIATKAFNLALKLTPWGIVIAALTTLAVLMPMFANAMGSAADKSRKLRDEQDALRKSKQDLNKAMDEGAKSAAAEVQKLEELYAAATNTNRSYKERKEAVDQLQKLYPAYFGNIRDEIILNGQAEKSYYKVRDAIIAKARAEAGSAELTRRQGERLTKEEAILKQIEKSRKTIADNNRDVEDPNYKGNKSEIDLRTDGEKANLARLERQLQDLRDYAKKEDEILVGIVENEKAKASGLTDAATGVPTVKTTGGKKDPKDKTVNRVELLKKEYEAVKAELEKQYEDRDISEAEFYKLQVKRANEFKDTKLTAIHNLSKEELQAQKDFSRDLTKERNDALDKQFNLELKAIERRRTLETKRVQDQIDEVEGDKSLSDTDRIARKIELDNELIRLQESYNNEVDGLEKKYTVLSTENADARAEALKALQKQLGKDLKEEQIALFNQLQETEKQAIRELQESTTNKLIGILTNEKLSPEQKKKQTKKVEEDANKEINKLRLQQIDADLAANASLLDQKLINQAEYNNRVAELEAEKLAIHQKTNEAEIENDRAKIALQEKIEQASFEIVNKALAAHIQILEAEVEANHKAAQEKLEIEREQRLANSQSKAEDESIKREFEAKEKEAEIKRNKERQAVARKQLALEFAVASMKALSTSSTIYEGLIKEAIVAAEYFASLAILNKQQFYAGGKVERLTDGLINARPNVPATPNGDNVLAYVKPGEVILNEQQQNALGGARTFSAIGVPGFSSYGGSVQPPVFRSYTSTGNGSNGNTDLQDMKQLFTGLVQIIGNEAMKPVVLNPNAVTDHQNKIAKNVNIATV